MKILIISANAFSKTYNNGKTLEAIFREFAPYDLCQLFTRPQDSTFTDYSFCNNYYVVSEMDIINKLRCRTKTCGGPLIKKSTSYQSDIYNRFKKSKVKHIGLLRDFLWSLNLWKTNELKDWIDEQKPDAVFLVGGGSRYLHSLGYYISSTLSVPLFLFYTDDYLLHPIYKGIYGKIQKKLIEKDYRRIVEYASGCFSIGELMSKEYGEFFKKVFFPIMNSVPIEEYIPCQPSIPNVISYFGGLHLNRWKMISRIAQCLPDNWNLYVYTASEVSEEISNSFKNANVILLGCVSGELLKEKMRDSNVLLHVESDDSYNRALTHLSVSTKIPEYLMAGRAIIGYGPQEVASMRLLTDNNIGIGIESSQTSERIKLELANVLNNHKRLLELGKRGYDYAVKVFDGVTNAKNFKNYILTLITNNQSLINN